MLREHYLLQYGQISKQIVVLGNEVNTCSNAKTMIWFFYTTRTEQIMW